jgi:methionyl-tRNA formyltransferase
MSEYPSIVWVGFHEEGKYALPAIIEAGFSVKAVLTLSDERALKRSGAFDVAAVARGYRVPCFKIDHINSNSSLSILNDLAPDVLLVIGWCQLLSSEALDTAGIVIGAHASLLPEGRGSAPINWAIIKRLKRTGNTLIHLSEAVDAGDIIAQVHFPITYEDTCATLYEKVAQSNRSMILDTLESIRAGRLEKQPQQDIDEPIWPRRRPEDGRLNWRSSSREVYDLVRALTRPYPGAYSYLDHTKVTIWRAKEIDFCGSPGSIAVADDSVYVACGHGGVRLSDVEVEGIGEYTGSNLVDYFLTHTSFDSSD